MKSMSSYADRYGLMSWFAWLSSKPKTVFIVHGESQAANALWVKINHAMKWDIAIPKLNEGYEL